MALKEVYTIMRPLMPIMKSNQGSMANSAFLFRSTWKPNAPWLELWDGASESRREMKRLRALNMVDRAVATLKRHKREFCDVEGTVRIQFY